MRNQRAAIFRLLAAGLSLAAAGGLPAQEGVIRVDVNLVRILATVKTADGRLVGALDKGDFELSDNGVKQEIAVFERETDQPLNITLLLDNSGSTAKELKYEVESLNRFLRVFVGEGNAKDAIALFTFNWEVRKLVHFTRNIGTLEQRLKGIKGEAGTSLYDAIYLASGELEGREGRKVIVVVTDGGDTTSSKDFHAALKAAHLADALIYSILVMPITNDAGRNIGGENALTTLGQRTGGRVFAPAIGAELDRAFIDILKELRTQYLIGYYPKNVPLTKNPFHTVTVQVNRPDLRVSARNGYYGEYEGDARPARGKVSRSPWKQRE